ncbi:MAG: hypothetical protein H6822_02295 [Planctomycetaceae bacterium]|nr:hypothetical protein [Planctomycetales bacterium]MCB9920981.1 hypothetical protein [Planctomycetaceae bacterium]
MYRDSIRDAVDSFGKYINDESKLCFGAAVGCFVIGTTAWLVNLVAPQTTTLHGLLVVAVFYAATGTISLFKRPATKVERPAESDSIDIFAKSFRKRVESSVATKSIA